MNPVKPLSLLLIEDEVEECIKFKDCVNSRGDAVFIGMTGSSYEGIKLLKNYLPEGVILDLELHKGSGSGLQFLMDFKEIKLGFKPIIIITTNVMSNVVYNHAHSIGVDMVFYKGQPDYSPDIIINTMLALRKSLHTTPGSVPIDILSPESPEELRARISDRIDSELDLVGVSPRLKGRQYLKEAIILLLGGETEAFDSVITQLTIIHKHSYTTISRAMQTAINTAWQSVSIEDLQVHYTARINIRTGVPSPTEFIYFYASKIRKTM